MIESETLVEVEFLGFALKFFFDMFILNDSLLLEKGDTKGEGKGERQANDCAFQDFAHNRGLWPQANGSYHKVANGWQEQAGEGQDESAEGALQDSFAAGSLRLAVDNCAVCISDINSLSQLFVSHED